MIEVNIENQREMNAFAEKAATDFRDHPKHYTFADGDPKEGELLAIRWNSIAVLVVRLGEMKPHIYPVHQLIGKDLPPMEPSRF